MAQYGRIQRTFQDSTGAPIAGLTVVVRKQGATVNGLHSGAQTSFTVNDPGGITSSPQDQLSVGTGTVVRAVSSVAATNVTVGGAGFNDVADDARLTPTTNLPSLYADAQGAEAAVLPLTTDANGEIVDANGAIVWAPVVPYDLHVSGANYTTRLLQDVVPEGQESVVSNIFPSASSVAFQKDTLRAQVSGSKLERWLSAGSEKFYIDLNASLNPRLPAHNVAGALTIDSGGLTITAGGETITAGDLTVTAGNLIFGAAASQIVPGVTSLSLRNNANNADNFLLSDAGAGTVRAGLTATTGNITATAGNVVATAGNLTAVAGEVSTRRLKAAFGTALANADFTLSAGWGTTASVTFPLGSAYDSRGSVRIASSGTGQGANPTVTLTFKNGSFSTGGWAVCQRGVGAGAGFGGDQPTVQFMVVDVTGGTAVTFSFRGTPVAGESYDLWWHVIA